MVPKNGPDSGPAKSQHFLDHFCTKVGPARGDFELVASTPYDVFYANLEHLFVGCFSLSFACPLPPNSTVAAASSWAAVAADSVIQRVSAVADEAPEAQGAPVTPRPADNAHRNGGRSDAEGEDKAPVRRARARKPAANQHVDAPANVAAEVPAEGHGVDLNAKIDRLKKERDDIKKDRLASKKEMKSTQTRRARITTKAKTAACGGFLTLISWPSSWKVLVLQKCINHDTRTSSKSHNSGRKLYCC